MEKTDNFEILRQELQEVPLPQQNVDVSLFWYLVLEIHCLRIFAILLFDIIATFAKTIYSIERTDIK